MGLRVRGAGEPRHVSIAEGYLYKDSPLVSGAVLLADRIGGLQMCILLWPMEQACFPPISDVENHIDNCALSPKTVSYLGIPSRVTAAPGGGGSLLNKLGKTLKAT